MLTEVPLHPVIKMDRFLVNEIFYSIQGEGVSLGLPAIFVRLQVCNLSCAWCDTKYTWDTSHPDYNYTEFTQAELLAQLAVYNCRRVIFTGGEPLLHAPLIENFLELLDNSWAIEIETNGTLAATPLIRERCQLNISPKLPSAKNRVKAVRPAVLKQLMQSPQAWFKFVVADLEDFAMLTRVVEECQIPAERVIVMPEGQDVQTLTEHALLIVEQVKERGYRLLPRLHVMLYGNQRGI